MPACLAICRGCWWYLQVSNPWAVWGIASHSTCGSSHAVMARWIPQWLHPTSCCCATLQSLRPNANLLRTRPGIRHRELWTSDWLTHTNERNTYFSTITVEWVISSNRSLCLEPHEHNSMWKHIKGALWCYMSSNNTYTCNIILYAIYVTYCRYEMNGFPNVGLL